MYDVIYIDAHGGETLRRRAPRPIAATPPRSPSRRRPTRGVGRMVLARVLEAARTACAWSPSRCPKRRSRADSAVAAARRGVDGEPLACRSMRIGVVGGGLMGSGIAEVCARAGVDVTVVEADTDAAERAQARIEKSLDRGVRSGKLSAERPRGGRRAARLLDDASRTSRAPTPRSRRSSRTSSPSASCSSGSTRCCPTPSSSPRTRRRCRS